LGAMRRHFGSPERRFVLCTLAKGEINLKSGGKETKAALVPDMSVRVFKKGQSEEGSRVPF